MKPNPPIWISVMITSCPNNDHCVYVSQVTRPVTQDALVAVKIASSGLTAIPLLQEKGHIKSNVPGTIKKKNPNAMIWVCVKFFLRIITPCKSLFLLPF